MSRLLITMFSGSHPKISATNKQNETQLGPLEFYATCFPGLEEVSRQKCARNVVTVFLKLNFMHCPCGHES